MLVTRRGILPARISLRAVNGSCCGQFQWSRPSVLELPSYPLLFPSTYRFTYIHPQHTALPKNVFAAQHVTRLIPQESQVRKPADTTNCGASASELLQTKSTEREHLLWKKTRNQQSTHKVCISKFPELQGSSKKSRFMLRQDRDNTCRITRDQQQGPWRVQGLCRHSDCKKPSSFGVPGDSRSCFCASHKAVGMVYITNKTCWHFGCTVLPSFALTRISAARFCVVHKQTNMQNVRKVPCQEPSCIKTPCYAIPYSPPRYCRSHRKLSMVNVLHRMCQLEGCMKVACFSLGGMAPPLYCGAHKTLGMTGVHLKLCKYAGCKISSSFGFIDKVRPTSCWSHQEPGMVNLKIFRRKKSNFFKIPHPPYPTEMIDYGGLSCSEYVWQILATWPASKSKARMKEAFVMAVIKMAYAKHTGSMRFDLPISKRVKPRCKVYRPDLWWDLDTHGLIVEVDEDQHRFYDKDADQVRTLQLQADAQKPVVFLRFNPDRYIDSMDVLHPACLSQTSLEQEDYASWVFRVDMLLKRMQACKNTVPQDNVTVEYLFFNGYPKPPPHCSALKTAPIGLLE